MSTEHQLTSIHDPSTSLNRVEQIGRYIWRRGLAIQAHRKRVEAEEAAIAERLKRSVTKAAHRKTPRVAPIKARALIKRRSEETRCVE